MRRTLLLLLGLLLFCRLGLAQISCTDISSNENTTDATSFTSSSLTHHGGRLQVFFVGNTKASAPDAPSTVTTADLTFVQVRTKVSTANDQRLSLYRAMGSSDNTNTITTDYGVGNTQTHWFFAWFECTGTSGTSGNNGSEAFNSNTADNVGTAVTSLAITVSSLASGNNGIVAGCALTTNTAITTEGGWTQPHTSVGGATPNIRITSEWIAGNSDLSAGFTFASSNAVGIAAELVAPSSPVPVFWYHYQRMMSFIFWRLPELCGAFGA